MPPSGLQDQQGLIHWDELEQPPEQEQRLLRQDNERLQREVQSTKADLAHSREKVTWAKQSWQDHRRNGVWELSLYRSQKKKKNPSGF